MYFPISGTEISPFYLIGLGFIIGILGGFFGVGGSFLAGPALFAVGVPMNFVVGTDLLHIVGKSMVAARRHRILGNIDLRLAMVMVLGTIGGSEIGVQGVEALKRIAKVDLVVGVTTTIVLVATSCFVFFESWMALKLKGSDKPLQEQTSQEKDKQAFQFIAHWTHSLDWSPKLGLPHSGIKSISAWAILLVSFVGGIFSGFLGGGAGYIRMPSMVYLLGIPTHIAIGTDLFEVMVSASYGSFRHALNGNVDVLIALIMQTGAAVGAQIGAVLTQYFEGPKIRMAFAFLPLIGAGLMIYGFMTGHRIH
ncbi:MAG TPA: sulfite exporter TauE/SafE family protein [Candidatus Methylacidiphilales bacterium]|nr:sulfite exporter TauE/SafE family protein [Candidatus Methylacidiphilales bacterium]